MPPVDRFSVTYAFVPALSTMIECALSKTPEARTS